MSKMALGGWGGKICLQEGWGLETDTFLKEAFEEFKVQG
jgi:nitrogen fixation protein